MNNTPSQKIGSEFSRFRHEFFKTVTTMVTSAFALVAALAWNTAITKILEQYLSAPSKSIFSWLLYAVIVTLIAVLVTIYVGHWAQKKDNEQQAEEK